MNSVDRGKLTSHLEGQLGSIQYGWNTLPTGAPCPFAVAKFANGPLYSGSSYATVGLSNFSLPSPVSTKIIHHELLISVSLDGEDGSLPSLLQDVAMEAISKNKAYVRGQVIGPRGPLIDGSSLEALYVTLPVYYPDSFSTCQSGGIDIAIAWLVPISRQEATYIGNQGWMAFEQMLATLDPNLLDINRQCIFRTN